MNNEVLEKYLKAGNIAKKVREESAYLVKPGAKILEIAQKLEQMIFKEGGKPAFPLNIGINETAAHFTPELGSIDVIKETDLVKIDIGVHVDGYIADTAVTYSMSKDEIHLKLIEAANSALKKAIEIAKPGVNIGKIGEVVEEEISKFGFKPIENLSGHGLDEYSLHAGLTIPNVKGRAGETLKENQVIALEPFSTNGEGHVSDAPEIHIYEFLNDTPTRVTEGRRILKMAQEEFSFLPFAKRWIESKIGKLKLALALRELVSSGALYQYPVLKEAKKGLVAQAEHTLVVGEKPVVTTL